MKQLDVFFFGGRDFLPLKHRQNTQIATKSQKSGSTLSAFHQRIRTVPNLEVLYLIKGSLVANFRYTNFRVAGQE